MSNDYPIPHPNPSGPAIIKPLKEFLMFSERKFFLERMLP